MGISTSLPEQPEIHKQLLARLRALESETRERQAEDLSKGYVYVSDAKAEADTSEPKLPTYEDLQKDISVETLERWEKELLADPKNRLAVSAFTGNAADSILSSRAAAVRDQHLFNVRIPIEGSPVTNQQSAGSCWLHAATNVFRIAMMKNYNIETFQLSQPYLFFFDKLEKAASFLQNVIDLVDEPLDGRLMQDLLAAPVNDGGQWDFVVNLVKKYGLVPRSLYLPSYSFLNSRLMDSLITTKLREDAVRLRALATRTKSVDSVLAAKNLMVREIHLILTIMLGPPPSPQQKFSWEFTDKDNKYRKVEMTPVEFARGLSDKNTIRSLGGVDVGKMFSLVNDPRHEYGKLLTVDRLVNVYDGRKVMYVNVDMATIKAAAIATLKKGVPVFFGCDVGQQSARTSGIMDADLFDYELGFNVRLGMSKAENLRTRQSQMTHAMVLTAVHVEDGKDVRWRVENSWGADVGDHGYMVMTSKWADMYMYQVVVDPSVVSSKVTDILKQEPIVLPHWDPMGALA